MHTTHVRMHTHTHTHSELTQKQQKNGDANDVDKSGGKVADAKPKPAGIRKLVLTLTYLHTLEHLLT